MLKEAKLQELLFWMNNVRNNDSLVKEWEEKGENAPIWLYDEQDRYKLMVKVIIKEAKEIGITDDEIKDVKLQVWSR